VKQYRDWEKQNRSWDKQLIIGISAHEDMNDSGQGIRVGMDAFLPKPITSKTLTELQGSSAMILRTRKLDEWDSSVKRVSFVDSNPSGRGTPSLFWPSSSNVSSTSVSVRERACLIATDTPAMRYNTLSQQLESMGWKVVVINDGTDCQRLLRLRNWDAVLIDDDLPQRLGVSCIAAFRKWEGQNRVNGQKNIFLVCNGDIPSPSDQNSWIQAPNGCNGVLRKPVSFNDLQCLLNPGGANGGMGIVVSGG
jgi:CheY-like chemotaxis protein